MPSKKVAQFTLSTSLTTDASRIDFLFADGTSTSLSMPSHRYAAAVATLQAVGAVYYNYDPSTKVHFLSTAPDIPGPS